MKPFTSAVNLTPSSTAALSGSAAFAGVAVGPQMVTPPVIAVGDAVAVAVGGSVAVIVGVAVGPVGVAVGVRVGPGGVGVDVGVGVRVAVLVMVRVGEEVAVAGADELKVTS